MGFIRVKAKAYLNLLCYLLPPFPCRYLLPGQPTNVPFSANNPANSLTVGNNQQLLAECRDHCKRHTIQSCEGGPRS